MFPDPPVHLIIALPSEVAFGVDAAKAPVSLRSRG